MKKLIESHPIAFGIIGVCIAIIGICTHITFQQNREQRAIDKAIHSCDTNSVSYKVFGVCE